MWKDDKVHKIKAVEPRLNQGYLYYNCFDVNNTRVKVSMIKVLAEITKYNKVEIVEEQDSI